MAEGVLPTGMFMRAVLAAALALLAVFVLARVRGWQMPRDVRHRLLGAFVLLVAFYVALLVNERPQTSFDALAWSGLLMGSILALSAIGLTLVYGILNLSNFAHGDLLTLGAYFAFLFATDFAGPGAVPAAVTLALLALGAALIDARVTKRLSRGERALLVATATVLAGGLLGILVPHPLRDLFVVLPRPALGALLLLAAGAFALHAWIRLREAPRPAWWPVAPIAGVALVGIVLAALSNYDRTSYAFLLFTAAGAVAAGHVARARPRGDRVPLIAGAVGAVGAFLFARALAPTTFLLSALVAVAGVVVFVVVLDLLLWKRLRVRRASILTLLIVSIGLALALRHAIQLWFGGDIQTFGRPPLAPYRLGAIRYNEIEILIIGVSAALVLATHLFLRLTRVGKAMRALADNPDLARVSGIDVDRIILYVWSIAGALAAVAGLLFAYWRSFKPTLGWDILLPTFAAVILGGIGSAAGALAGAISIGLAMELSSAWIDTSYKQAVAFIVLVVLLLVRPQGIFGGKVQ